MREIILEDCYPGVRIDLNYGSKIAQEHGLVNEKNMDTRVYHIVGIDASLLIMMGAVCPLHKTYRICKSVMTASAILPLPLEIIAASEYLPKRTGLPSGRRRGILKLSVR